MPENRFYHSHFPFKKNLKLQLEDKEFHHLHRVMRHGVGDMVELVNGRFELAQGKILEIKKESAIISILDVFQSSQKFLQTTLVQALPKLPRLEWIIEKCTELGVSRFCLIPGSHSEKKDLSEAQLARLRMLSISAMKQCGRLDLPALEWYTDLEMLPPQEQMFYGDPDPSSPFFKDMPIDGTKPIMFCIGPEKGWSEKERGILKNHFNAKSVRLHHYTLRSDTAAIISIHDCCLFSLYPQ